MLVEKNICTMTVSCLSLIFGFLAQKTQNERKGDVDPECAHSFIFDFCVLRTMRRVKIRIREQAPKKDHMFSKNPHCLQNKGARLSSLF